jgi:hypothetical protein
VFRKEIYLEIHREEGAVEGDAASPAGDRVEELKDSG